MEIRVESFPIVRFRFENVWLLGSNPSTFDVFNISMFVLVVAFLLNMLSALLLYNLKLNTVASVLPLFASSSLLFTIVVVSSNVVVSEVGACSLVVVVVADVVVVVFDDACPKYASR